MATVLYVFVVDPDTSQKKTTLNLRHVRTSFHMTYPMLIIDWTHWQFPLAKVHMQNLVNLYEFRNLVLLCFRELSCDTVSTVLANARKQGSVKGCRSRNFRQFQH